MEKFTNADFNLYHIFLNNSIIITELKSTVFSYSKLFSTKKKVFWILTFGKENIFAVALRLCLNMYFKISPVLNKKEHHKIQ
jgi:hypothetical protein